MKPSYWLWHKRNNLLAIYQAQGLYCELTILDDDWDGDKTFECYSIFDLPDYGWIILGDVED